MEQTIHAHARAMNRNYGIFYSSIIIGAIAAAAWYFDLVPAWMTNVIEVARMRL
jgi:hypothetical protein